jgi:hypothetical protein
MTRHLAQVSYQGRHFGVVQKLLVIVHILKRFEITIVIRDFLDLEFSGSVRIYFRSVKMTGEPQVGKAE